MISKEILVVSLAAKYSRVLGHSLRDVSCPYASYFNAELTTALGREWSKEGFWTSRTYGFAALGMANQGAPWLRALGAWEVNWTDRHRLMLGFQGYFGFGGKKHVDVEHFHGWSHVHHQSIDLGIGYAYHTLIGGTIGFNYAHRVFAKSFPQNVNFFTFFYCLPFSLL